MLQYSNAQLNEYFNDIKKTYKVDKQKELVKIGAIFKDADSKYSDVQQKFNSGNASKGQSEIKKVSKVYSKTYRELFLLYENKLETLEKEAGGDKSDYIKYLIEQSKNSFRISISNRLEAKKEDKEKDAFDLYISAHNNEVDAINFQSRAFGVANGWINEDFKIEKPNYSCKDTYDNSTTDNSTTDNFKIKDFTENNISLPSNYTFNKPNTNVSGANNSEVVGGIDSNESYAGNEDSNTYYYNTNNYNNSVDNVNSSFGTEYRIQIGVSILSASKSQIERLNKTSLDVKTYKSKVYYKYTIGNFVSYDEAKQFKNSNGLTKNYITEYKDGKEIKFYYKDI